MRRRVDVWTVTMMAVLLVLGFASNPAAWAQESPADTLEQPAATEKTEKRDETEKEKTGETDPALTAEGGDGEMRSEESQRMAEQTGEQTRQQSGQEAEPGEEMVMITVSLPVFEATAGQIAATPAAYYGSVVRVDAEVEDVLGGNSFTLDEDRVGAGPDVLVVAPRSSVAAIPEGEHVEVVGHLRPLVVSEFERDYDWFDQDSVDVELESRPVLIAASIRTQDGRELMASTTDATTTTTP